MSPSVLYPLLEAPSSAVRHLAEAALSGQAGALEALHDSATEEGLFMQSVKAGQCYMVKTPTHYYLGRVLSVSFAEIVMTEAMEVYDTGALTECYGNGTPASYEAFPADATVSIPTGAIVAVILWGKKLPRRTP